MKRSIGILALILVMMLTGSALMESVSFTHPEIGEFLTISFKGHLPSFSIYDFTYYEMVDSETAWRGMHANAAKLVNNKMLALDESLEYLFDSVEGLTEDLPPVDFMYTGLLADYGPQLQALDRGDRIRAIKILGGFEGAKGYRQLNKIAGFEDLDVQPLEENHVEFTVKADNRKYAYRSLMFHVDDGNWIEYNERYTYLKVSGTWKLARITKEYTDDYRTRGVYLHGMTGSDPAEIAAVNEEALLNLAFGAKLQEAEEVLNTKADKNEIILADASIYRLPAPATLVFKSGRLSKISYALKNEQAFYSAFISLYTRYSDPVVVDEQGSMSWSTNDLLISLNKNGDMPELVFEPYQ